MSDYFEHIAGATPIDLESQKGLKLGTITTRDQLNAAEQNNILKALNWADTSRALKTIEDALGGCTFPSSNKGRFRSRNR
jgi:hypothetical protein